MVEQADESCSVEVLLGRNSFSYSFSLSLFTFPQACLTPVLAIAGGTELSVLLSSPAETLGKTLHLPGYFPAAKASGVAWSPAGLG